MTLYLIFWGLAAIFTATAVCRAVWTPHICQPGSEHPSTPSQPSDEPSPPRPREPVPAPPADEMGEVHRMLKQLDRQQPRLAKLVLLRWIGGMSSQRAAETLGLAVETVERDLHFARSLLRQQIGPAAGARPS